MRVEAGLSVSCVRCQPRCRVHRSQVLPGECALQPAQGPRLSQPHAARRRRCQRARGLSRLARAATRMRRPTAAPTDAVRSCPPASALDSRSKHKHVTNDKGEGEAEGRVNTIARGRRAPMPRSHRARGSVSVWKGLSRHPMSPPKKLDAACAFARAFSAAVGLPSHAPMCSWRGHDEIGGAAGGGGGRAGGCW